MAFFDSSTEVRVGDSRSLAANVVFGLAPLLGRNEDVGHCAGPMWCDALLLRASKLGLAIPVAHYRTYGILRHPSIQRLT
jgi:hypothetical protein